MEQRIFHGDITPNDLADALVGEFDKGNWRAQKLGDDRQMVVQIATREYPAPGGQTAMAVTLRTVEDGVAIQIGKQSWFGVAASLGQTALSAIRNPWSLLERLDDLAQDVENLKLTEEVWYVLEKTAGSIGANFELSERLRRLVCEYCLTANPVGEPSCIACGAPLGRSQPGACPNCGFVVKTGEMICPNCKMRLG
jgi:hypothetical protein